MVAECLPQCPNLRRLNLDGNQIETCAAHFLAALQSSYSIVALMDGLPKLLSSKRGDPTWKQVDVLLRANAAKRRFFQAAQDHVDAILPIVLASAAAQQQPDVLFYFFQHLGRPFTAKRASRP